MSTCQHCQSTITRESAGWVDTLSGDDGGTYDYCPEATNNRHVPVAQSARKATMWDARRAYTAGARVVVTETPRGDRIDVYPSTTTHHVSSMPWEHLHDVVKAWRGRYPRQTFYVMDEDRSSSASRQHYIDTGRYLFASEVAAS